jgi:A/G-specific adenine glycosylase
LTPTEKLLAWYDRERRDLPWRGLSDPWPIWVSEVMLQQTRVETAIPYFHRFLELFPTPGKLAEAAPEAVLAAWSGLGYYRRARLLQAAAREVVASGGTVPRSRDELARLPGIGPYTAAAIASIAFGEAVAVLDGNVERVLARYSAEAESPTRSGARRRLLALAAQLLDPERPGDSNQALMELGATICLPREPRCGECPLAGGCRARAAGETARFPVAVASPRIEVVAQVAAVVERDGRLLLYRRGEQERQMAGLWELPLVDASRADVAARRLARRFGGAWTVGAPAARVGHTITHRRFEIVARRAEHALEGVELREGPEAGWFGRSRAAELALTGVARKLLARLAPGEPASGSG